MAIFEAHNATTYIDGTHNLILFQLDDIRRNAGAIFARFNGTEGGPGATAGVGPANTQVCGSNNNAADARPANFAELKYTNWYVNRDALDT